MHMSVGSIANFTGTLVEAHQKPGNKYMQLVFHTAEGIKLSISRNGAMVRSLKVGEKYHVKGKVMRFGTKTYINEPTAILVKAAQASRKKRIVLCIVLGVVMSASAAAFANTRGPAGVNTPESQSDTAGTSQPAAPVAQPAPAPAAVSQPAPTPAPSAVRPASSTATKRTTTPAAVSSPAVVAPTPAPPSPAPASIGGIDAGTETSKLPGAADTDGLTGGGDSNGSASNDGVNQDGGQDAGADPGAVTDAGGGQ